MLDSPRIQQLESTVIETQYFSLTRSDVLVGVLLFFALLLGGYFRFMSHNWDDFVRFHPDERYLVGVAGSLGGNLTTNQSAPDIYQRCLERHPNSNGKGGYFDTDCSPFHPENVVFPHYVYGTLPLFMARAAAEITADWTKDPIWLTYHGIFQVWRGLSSIADMLVLWLVFLIGMRLHGKWVGLIAAMLYAFAVFPIQQSHFGTTDPITNLFVSLALFFAVRTQDSGSQWDYAGFGLALGAAVASRINVAPLAAVIAVVAVVRMLPVLDRRLSWDERNRLLTSNTGGVMLAAVMSFIVFRLFQPYAFHGPTIFGILPDERYLKTLAHAQYTVSGESEIPPNYQWVNRTGFLFPFQNMVLWGMGVALGLTAWLSWLWTGWRMLRARPNATRRIVLFVWVGGYFLFAGNLWVMSMRYYLPLYPALAVLAAWGLVEIVRRAWQSDDQVGMAQYGLSLRKMVSAALLIGVVGFTLLWALMFTNIYRHMATFTQASHWVWENIPGDFAMRIDDAGEDVPLINIPLNNSYIPDGTPIEDWLYTGATRLLPDIPVSAEFTAPVDGIISMIYAPHIGDPVQGADEKTLHFKITQIGDNNPLATATLTSTFARDEHVLGTAYEITLDEPLHVQTGQRYTFTVEIVDGGPLITAGAVMALESAWEEVMPAKVCHLPDGITLADDPPSGLNTIQNCDGRDAWNGLLNGYLVETHWEDIPEKRNRMQLILDQTDYVMIPTNRRYDTHSRNPMRWPMTNRFYEALFSGELGFDLVATFQETFEFGPFKISDQHLPTYSSPAWLNEFEAEEAFHVYDHPVVFIFKKRDGYEPANTAAILNSVSLNRVQPGYFGYNDPSVSQVVTFTSLQADEAPTALMMTPEMRQIQIEGGTWSERFNSESLLNTNQAMAVVAWWLVVVLFGLLAFPILFVVFPALADRGYGFAKFAGILLVAWGTWYLSSMRIPVWSQGGILAGLLILLSLSTVIFWFNRQKMLAYLTTHWRLLMWIEVIGFVLYLIFVQIRLTNPDLWHSSYGGEKPMDFSYFNAVLRSTIFPPIDPWFAGGYMNYYYFGFVIVGVPTLLTGIMPSLAFNLIIPMLFSLTGVAAFSAAFNISSGWRTSSPLLGATSENEAAESGVPARKRPLGNPWMAGITALLLAVVLGNLDTPRVVMNGIAQLGGYKNPASMQIYFQNQLTDEYIKVNGVAPQDEALTAVIQQAILRAEQASIGDHIRYALDYPITLAQGVGKLLRGERLYISPDRWFWGPTRIVAETSVNSQGIPTDGAIHEMPFFTFLYADLHAHMIAMPMMIFAVIFVYNELMTAGRDRRSRIARFGALFVGAMTVGLFQATNTWDLPTFLIFSVLGLSYAWWLAWRRINRWSLLAFVLRIGGFGVILYLAVLPYTWWFASTLTQFKVWEGKKTTIWAYLTIHGAFIFLLVSLLIWETARWLRSVRVSALRGKALLVYSALAGGAMVLLGTLILVIAGYRIALIVVPLVAWIAVLFFRPGQSRPMQFVLVLAGLALSITFGTEIITLALDNGRQNTIFKFYIQVWLLLSVMGGVAFAWVVRNSLIWSTKLAVGWYILVGLLFFVSALYPIQATRGKSVFRLASNVPTTLDGMEFLKYTQYAEQGAVDGFNLADDFNAIRWLQEHVHGSPVIMEAQSYGSLYKWGGRIAMFTGLPSVLGWDYHQRQQRSIDPLPSLVNQRGANVNAFYSTPDILAAADILRLYQVQYVVKTSYEQARYADTGGLDKFNEMVERGMLEIVYQEGGATIYRVDQDMLTAVWIAYSETVK